MELRPFLSDPELMGAGDGSSHINVVLSGCDGYQTLPSRGTNMRNPLEQVYLVVQQGYLISFFTPTLVRNGIFMSVCF